MEPENLDITSPRYNKPISLGPWHFVNSRFNCTKLTIFRFELQVNMNATLRRDFAQTSVPTQMVATPTGESGMLWTFPFCGSYQESSFMTLEYLINHSIWIPRKVMLAVTLDQVSYNMFVKFRC